MNEHPAVGLLKRDVAATLGAAHGQAVDRQQQLLLPYGQDWPQDVFGARLIGDVQQEFHDTFVDTTWPHCTAHPNHPLWFDDGAWRCNTTGAAVAALGDLDVVYFNDAIEGLRRGDFDRLAPLYVERDGGPIILRWQSAGRFAAHPRELAEALSNAAFLGRTQVVTRLLDAGVDVTAGTGCGMDALHWAANRGKVETVRQLIARGAPLETVNMHGTTALGTAVWSAVNEPWWGDAQLEIVNALLAAGARVEGIDYPSGRADVDELLRRAGAGK